MASDPSTIFPAKLRRHRRCEYPEVLRPKSLRSFRLRCLAIRTDTLLQRPTGFIVLRFLLTVGTIDGFLSNPVGSWNGAALSNPRTFPAVSSRGLGRSSGRHTQVCHFFERRCRGASAHGGYPPSEIHYRAWQGAGRAIPVSARFHLLRQSVGPRRHSRLGLGPKPGAKKPVPPRDAFRADVLRQALACSSIAPHLAAEYI